MVGNRKEERKGLAGRMLWVREAGCYVKVVGDGRVGKECRGWELWSGVVR